MNAADVRRLELAKRAFEAAQPGDAEVQTGVRRARLSLDRSKRRRTWFSKGLVFVVLAVGGLAYAKPHALGEIVEKVLPREPASAPPLTRLGLVGEPVEARLRRVAETQPRRALKPVGASSAVDVDAPPPLPRPKQDLTSMRSIRADAVQAPVLRRAMARAVPPEPVLDPMPAAAPTPSAPTPSALSDWGRVGQALARGDKQEALAALDELSSSEDPRIRDKADLGRAQLLLAHGEPNRACALARSLTHRRAGGRIERQAQLLLKSCSR